MNKQDILNRLNEITKSYSFLYVLIRIVFRDFCGSIDTLFSKNTQEHFNQNEFAFLLGLWIKNVEKENVFDNKTEIKIVDEVYKLMYELHCTFLEDYKFDINNLPDFKEHFANGKILQESMFYSGTGAYDLQYIELAISKYKHDIEWIKRNKGFDINMLPEFYMNVKNKLLSKLNMNSKEFLKESPERSVMVNTFCLTKEEIINDKVYFEQILEHFTIDISQVNNLEFNDLGDFNVFSEKPILKIDSNCYFIPSNFALSESIYESLYYWMLTDKEYSKIALKHRGDVAEDITKIIIEPIFGADNIFQNIIINKTKNDQVTDVDILAISGCNALIFQVKSKKLTALSKKGNLDSIKKDFEKAVQDAYDQAIVSKECLKEHENYKFPKQDQGFIEKLSDIQNYFIVTILLDDYPAITQQVHILLDNNKSDELPVAISIFDLALISKYLDSPKEFINYISNRIKFSKYFIASNEASFLGYHLKYGLHKTTGDLVYLDESWAQSIDKLYHEEVYLKKNSNVKKKIQRNDPCFCMSGLKYKKCHGKMKKN